MSKRSIAELRSAAEAVAAFMEWEFLVDEASGDPCFIDYDAVFRHVCDMNAMHAVEKRIAEIDAEQIGEPGWTIGQRYETELHLITRAKGDTFAARRVWLTATPEQRLIAAAKAIEGIKK